MRSKAVKFHTKLSKKLIHTYRHTYIHVFFRAAVQVCAWPHAGSVTHKDGETAFITPGHNAHSSQVVPDHEPQNLSD